MTFDLQTSPVCVCVRVCHPVPVHCTIRGAQPQGDHPDKTTESAGPSCHKRPRADGRPGLARDALGGDALARRRRPRNSASSPWRAASAGRRTGALQRNEAGQHAERMPRRLPGRAKSWQGECARARAPARLQRIFGSDPLVSTVASWLLYVSAHQPGSLGSPAVAHRFGRECPWI